LHHGDVLICNVQVQLLNKVVMYTPIFAAYTGVDAPRYDQQHLVTYLRLLDADGEGADWQVVAKIVLHIDPEREPKSGKACVGRPFGPCELAKGERFSPSSPRRCASLNLFLCPAAT
jgi:hypothetical protein